MTWFAYDHVVGFAETNVVGNVYFSHYVSWQGRCRELFIREKCPGLLGDIESGRLSLVTRRVACAYAVEARAFDRVQVRMSLEGIRLNHIAVSFSYVRSDPAGETVIATGEQEVACMQRTSAGDASGPGLIAIPVPEALSRALLTYRRPAPSAAIPAPSTVHGLPS
jgi:enediyne biosynthesis thioesterase